MQTYPIAKAAASSLDYSLDLSRWLVSGDTIATATVVSDQPDLTLTTATHTPTVATTVASGGAASPSYVLTWTITTTAGRVLSRKTGLSIDG